MEILSFILVLNSYNKNKNTQDFNSSKTVNETANEDKELIKYLYDKEIERSKLIVEKTTAVFFLGYSEVFGGNEANFADFTRR